MSEDKLKGIGTTGEAGRGSSAKSPSSAARALAGDKPPAKKPVQKAKPAAEPAAKNPPRKTSAVGDPPGAKRVGGGAPTPEAKKAPAKNPPRKTGVGGAPTGHKKAPASEKPRLRAVTDEDAA